MATELRTDESHHISYPQTPDTRGTARIYHLRKPYYLGSHDSPLSYVMFGLWKHHLMESGVAPSTAQIRERAEDFLGVVPTPKQRMLTVGLMASALTLTSLFGVFVGVRFCSTSTVTHVDGIALTANEREFIRGVRNKDYRVAALDDREVSKASMNTLAVSKGQVSKDEILRRIRGN